MTLTSSPEPVIELLKTKLGTDVGEDKLSGKSPPDVPMSFWFVPTAETFPMTEDKLMIKNINTIQVDDIFLDSSKTTVSAIIYAVSTGL